MDATVEAAGAVVSSPFSSPSSAWEPPTVSPPLGIRTPLLPPPPPPPVAMPPQVQVTPEPAAEIAVPIDVPAVSPGGMITPPPSIALPTSPANDGPEASPIADVVFFSSPVSSALATAGISALVAPDDEADRDATRVSVRRRMGSPWRLVLPDGQHFVVEKTVLIGRDAAPNPRWPGAQLLSVTGDTKSVSKTHAAIEADSVGLWVTDLASTNGVVITTPDGGEINLDGSERVLVEPGCDIELGDFVIQVEKG